METEALKMETEALKAACLQVGIVLNEEEVKHILLTTQDRKQQSFLENTELPLSS